MRLPTTRCSAASSNTVHSRSGFSGAEMRSCLRIRTCTRLSMSACAVSGSAPAISASAYGRVCNRPGTTWGS